MDAEQLRALQAPIKERYKKDAASAVVTLRGRVVAVSDTMPPGWHSMGDAGKTSAIRSLFWFTNSKQTDPNCPVSLTTFTRMVSRAQMGAVLLMV